MPGGPRAVSSCARPRAPSHPRFGRPTENFDAVRRTFAHSIRVIPGINLRFGCRCSSPRFAGAGSQFSASAVLAVFRSVSGTRLPTEGNVTDPFAASSKQIRRLGPFHLGKRGDDIGERAAIGRARRGNTPLAARNFAQIPASACLAFPDGCRRAPIHCSRICPKASGVTQVTAWDRAIPRSDGASVKQAYNCAPLRNYDMVRRSTVGGPFTSGLRANKRSTITALPIKNAPSGLVSRLPFAGHKPRKKALPATSVLLFP